MGYILLCLSSCFEAECITGVYLFIILFLCIAIKEWFKNDCTPGCSLFCFGAPEQVEWKWNCNMGIVGAFRFKVTKECGSVLVRSKTDGWWNIMWTSHSRLFGETIQSLFSKVKQEIIYERSDFLMMNYQAATSQWQGRAFISSTTYDAAQLQITLESVHGLPITGRSPIRRTHPRRRPFANLFQSRQWSVGYTTLGIGVYPQQACDGTEFSHWVRFGAGFRSRIESLDCRTNVTLGHGIGTTRLLDQNGRQRSRSKILGQCQIRGGRRMARNSFSFFLFRIRLAAVFGGVVSEIVAVQLLEFIVFVIVVVDGGRMIDNSFQYFHVNGHSILPLLPIGRSVAAGSGASVNGRLSRLVSSRGLARTIEGRRCRQRGRCRHGGRRRREDGSRVFHGVVPCFSLGSAAHGCLGDGRAGFETVYGTSYCTIQNY